MITGYEETCASIGLVFFAFRLLQLDTDGSYADVIEKALYNIILGGMGLDGKSFFYVNPLEVWPEACEKNPTRQHVKHVRQKWYGCACCPPNVARLLSSLGQYVYTSNEREIYVHQYISGEAGLELAGGRVKVSQTSGYPFHGSIRLSVTETTGSSFSIGMRIPGWCRNYSISVNGNQTTAYTVVKGYAILERIWAEGDTIGIELDMPAEFIQANPKVRADAGKLAIQRGPLVYCLEETDNGANLQALSVSPDAGLTAEYDENCLGGVMIVKARGFRIDERAWKGGLYRPFEKLEEPVEIKAIPYCKWGNRGSGEMLVWIRGN